MDKHKLAHGITARKKKISSVLKELISKETINPPGDEFLVADYAEKYFKKKKIKTKKFEKVRGRTNLIASVGNEKPELMIVAHSDVVPAGTGWKTHPFKGVEKKGRMYGRGSGDNKGPMAAAMVFLSELKKQEKEMKGTVSLFIAADEEKGSALGAEFLLKEKKIKPDYVLIPDVFTENKEISIGEKGLLHVKASAEGVQAHASEPWRGKNAIEKMTGFLCEFGKWKLPSKKVRHFGGTTKNIGMINGGNAPNTVPNHCEAVIDFRYPPGMTAGTIVSGLKKIGKKHGVKISVIENQKPFIISEGNELFYSLKKNVPLITGKKLKITSMPGTTICKKFVLYGIPAVGFGPGSMVIHMSNEFIELKQLTEFAQICALVAADLVF